MRISDWSSDVCSSDLFQQMPAPAGQSFVIQAADSSRSGSLEFAQYAGLVRQQLMAQGYAPAPSPSAASLVVELDYGVSGDREYADLLRRFEVRQVALHYDEGRQLDGATAEKIGRAHV